MGFYDIEWTRCYQISMIQEYLSQQVINRFFYQSNDVYAGSLSAISSGWYSLWATYATPIQSDECLYKTVRVLELFGERQTFDGDVSGANGSQLGALLPAFFGARFSLTPGNTRVKKGRKILSGILEEMVDENTVAAAYADDFNDFLTMLEGGFSVAAIDFAPVLLSPANTKHPLDVITAIVDATFKGWSTQASRKVGRGS